MSAMAAPREHDGADEHLMELPSMRNPDPPPPPLPAAPPRRGLNFHPAVYVGFWITLSSATILFNKWILSTCEFAFPIFLTTWHLVFATAATQLLARTTDLLDGRHRVKMTGRIYLRAIMPIGLFFSLSLICSNKAYIYLSVAFIQMLKATTPVAVLVASWALSLSTPSLRTLGNVALIVVGVIIASWGEIALDATGVIYQVLGICFEATRLVMVQRLLSANEYKMDPLVSLYYFAPVCALINGAFFLVLEAGQISWVNDVMGKVGLPMLTLNACVAFALNVSVVFLIGRTSSLVLTLCGVLKDILLVVLSILIWQTEVTLLQFIGYSIALAGLVWYKLGPEKVLEHLVLLKQAAMEGRALGVVAVGVVTVLLVGVVWYAFSGPEGGGV
ncbi:triose-phosphate transporter family-domain-containing protein [Tricharina praecox]|uniref:triose-phosphate transporter family-domain-containing protein n=1 Tax=Tricharina praecox TaxID=43433 RepID=UPI00221E6CDB|nr:triose-phosphate transporter family-domain-containing protein [Tricharina praecox]KAI5849154.1 triose-phosphate transporter family-domain-containing protein [Tricharina praecox]